MIAPYAVGPMSVTGFTWYQGESDLGGDASLPEQNNNYTCTQTGPSFLQPPQSRGIAYSIAQPSRMVGRREEPHAMQCLTVQL